MAAIPAQVRADTAAGLADFQEGRFAEAFHEWRQAAEAGDTRGALFIGVLYDAGLGMPQSYAQAFAWYRRAAEAGNAAAMFNVAVLYDLGRGIPRDSRQAAAWYARAAAKGFARAEYNLAMMYEEGAGVPRSRSRAVELYIRAARHGLSAARAHLARLGYRVAAGARSTDDPAMIEFQKAERILLNRGAAGAARAAELLRRAAENGNAPAEYDLGYFYEKGLGVPRDLHQAYLWYWRAIAHAPNDALRSLALAGARNLKDQLSQARQSKPVR
ncbi:MAG: tetratricopeptide repeat protein [Stellaceae bacterium]